MGTLYHLNSIEMIIWVTAMNPAVDLQSKKRTCRTTSGVLPFIGEISKVSFWTKTENDVHQQQHGVNQALTLANINAKELNYLGSVLKKALVIHKVNMGINLEAVMVDTAAVQNILMAFGRYTVRKRIQEQLISMTKKLELISLQFDVQFQTLLSDVNALTTGVLRPTLVTFQGMLQFKAILEGQAIDQQFPLTSVSQKFKTASLYTRPVLVGNVLILTLRVPLLCRSKSFSLFESKTFLLPLHGHFSQLIGLPTYLIVSNTYINLILNSISGVKAYCQFKLLIQSVPSPPHIDYLIQGHYLLTNIPGLSVICKSSSGSDVRVIRGCSSCLYNFPCHCTVRTSNLSSYAGFHGCAYKRSSKVHLVGFTVNLGFF